jgi:hypothetical protein
MKVSRRHGALRLRLDQFEGPLLDSLLSDLAQRLRDGVDLGDDPVERRLFPSAYDEDDAAGEFRELTEAGLRADRVERAEACRTELESAGLDVSLETDAGERWIRAINDLRLIIGTQLEITEDDDPEPDPDDPDGAARNVYYWLTYVQDSMVRALAR